MKNSFRPVLKSVVFIFFFLATSLVHALAQEKRATGLREPSLSDLAERARSAVWTRKVLPNQLALDRMRMQKLLSGRPTGFDEAPAPFGKENLGFSSGEGGGDFLSDSQRSTATSSSLGRVDNSLLPSFPAIGDQGQIGSCVSFAATYTIGTHMLAMARGINAQNRLDLSTKLSPKFTYNLMNGGADRGSTIIGTLAFLKSFGAPFWKTWPYVGNPDLPRNFLEWPRTAEVWREAAHNRFKEWGVIQNVNTPAGLSQAKASLANGYVLAFGTNIRGWKMTTFQDDPATSQDNDLVGRTVCWAVEPIPSGHAMVVVGYDDQAWTDINRNGRVDSGEKGAFKIANSWGDDWRNGGFVWVAYDALNRVSAVDGANFSGRQEVFRSNELYWISANEGYSPKLLGEFTVSHPIRKELQLRLGRSLTARTTPEQSSASAVLTRLGGAWAFDGGPQAVDGTFVFDFSDLVFPGVQRYYVSVRDDAGGGSAQLKSFRLTSPGGQVLATATSGIPSAANANTVHAFVDFGGTVAPVVSVPISVTGRVGQPFPVLSINATNSPTSYSATGLAPGLVLDTATGRISGTPTQAGTFRASVSATNSSGTGSSDIRFEIVPSLAPGPVITSNASASGRVGVPFAYQIVASNSPTSYGAAGLPFGLGVNATSGLISGTPSQAGLSAVSLSATNVGGTGSRSLTLLIEAAAMAVPVITSETAVQGVSGQKFLYRITASNSPVSYGAENLPSGLVLNSITGEITGVLPAARVYYLTVKAINTSGMGARQLVLTVTGGALEGPANDDFDNRVPVSGVSVTAEGSNFRATVEPGEPSHAGQASHSAWWSWVAPRTSKTVVSLSGSSFDTVLGVYTGSAVNALATVGVNDDQGGDAISRVEFDAVMGTAYQIAVDGRGDAQGAIKLSIEQQGGTPPDNDRFQNAAVISGNEGNFTVSTVDASREEGEPGHMNQLALKSVWWKWTAPENGQVVVDTIGSPFDTVLAVYTGNSLSNLTLLAQDDQSGGSNTSRVSIPVLKGTTYHFAVDGRGGASGVVRFRLSASQSSPPANDLFQNAKTLSGATVTDSVTSQSATAETGEPAHAGFEAARSVWWSWTSPTDGVVRVTTEDSDFDTLLAVYRGSSLHDLVLQEENDDTGGQRTSAVEFEAKTGTTYFIAVDGYEGVGGAVALRISQSAAPTNDHFDNRLMLSGNFSTSRTSNAKASSEAGEPEHDSYPAGKSLWWSWTAPYTGQVSIDTLGSNFDTVLAVYTGETFANLKPVVSNDDFGVRSTSFVSFQAKEGETYQIAVDGYQSDSGRVDLLLELSERGVIYQTNFDYFPVEVDGLTDFDGWQSLGSGIEASGIFEDDEGNRAGWIGDGSSADGYVSLYRDVDVAKDVGVVEFSVDMAIVDSTEGREYDDFLFVIRNRGGEILGSVVFENSSLKIFRGDGVATHDTRFEFSNGTLYEFRATLDLARNRWTAYLGDQMLFQDQPITATPETVDIGSIDIEWDILDVNKPGDNYMIFDNYRIATFKGIPEITSPGQAKVMAGADFLYPIVATNSPTLYSATGLHAGLSTNATTGQIQGRPTETGTRQVVLSATNSGGTGQKVLLLTVESPQKTPLITSDLNATGKVGSPLPYYRVVATNSPTSFNVVGLPSGLTFNSTTGEIGGTPTAPGKFPLTIQASNDSGMDQKTLNLEIAAPPPPPPPPAPPSSSSASQSGQSSFGSSQKKDKKISSKKKSKKKKTKKNRR